MIRFFEVLGLGDEPEYFGFMDTGTDRIVEIDGAQVFGDLKDFQDYLSTSGFPPGYRDRLCRLIPEHWRSV